MSLRSVRNSSLSLALPQREVVLPIFLLTVGLAFAVAAPEVPIAAGLVAAALIVWFGLRDARVLVAALIFAVPFSRWTKVEIGEIAVTAADVLLAILVAAWLIRGLAERRFVLHVSPTIIAALALFTSALVSTLAADDFPTALEELVKLAEMISIALFGAVAFRQPRTAAFAAQALVLAAAAESLVALVQSIAIGGPASFALGNFVRAYGDFEQPNALGGYLAMALPFGVVLAAQRYRQRPLLLAATLLIGLTLAATLSRGAWLGSALGLLLIGALWSKRSRRLLAVGMLAGGAGLALLALGIAPQFVGDRLTVLTENFLVFDARTVTPNPSNWSLVERMAHWQAGWAIAMDHPLVGVGPGNYEAAYGRYFLPGWPYALGHAHNVYINTFAEMGLVGLAALLVFLAILFVRIGQGVRAFPEGSFARTILLGSLGAATAFAIHNMFDNMFVHGIGIQFGLIIGLAEAALAARSSFVIHNSARPPFVIRNWSEATHAHRD